MTTAIVPVPLDELICMFVGVPVDTDRPDEWSTMPSHSVQLAFEIARRTDPQSELALRRTLYGDTVPDLIGQPACQAISLGYERYRLTRQMQGTRGL